MLLQLQRYTLDVKYTPGRLMYLADTLSRAHPEHHDPNHDQESKDLEEEMEVMVHELVATKPASDEKVVELKEATAKDKTLQSLLRVIREGWPDHRRSLPEELRPYWHCKEEIHEAEGLLFRNEAIIIPDEKRREMKRRLHEAHLGIEKTKARARDVFYWPGINADIEEVVGQCTTCLRYRSNNQREPMIAHQIPDLPWLKVGTDIMTLKGKDYLVVVDYHSKYPEIALLEDNTASTVVPHLKSIFARHGIPMELVSDNIPYSSETFRHFAQDWEITLNPSSPCYPRSNGESKRFVQIPKNLMKKAADEARDPYLSLMEYRATPITGTDLSPSQLLFRRRLRTKLPVLPSTLRPKVVQGQDQLQQQKVKQAKHYDKGTKPLPPLQRGEIVRVRVKDEWQPALVTGRHQSPRSYVINHQGREKRRNRSQLLKTDEKSLPVFVSDPDPDLDQLSIPHHDLSRHVIPTKHSQVVPASEELLKHSQPLVQPAEVKTLSGRVVRKPLWLKDFACQWTLCWTIVSISLGTPLHHFGICSFKGEM